ncbi:NAD(P)-binding Rossmann-fold containing protein-5 [Coleophoma crateriformis]|uniref:NAD(P)-binding Rossmann-fold containing protein-5 n=1 Tax=Coleophoma crateriformis TaxID=565419 RepID=A0A3D8SHV2_9HELO|nr:NAD(P)-binding Rossmann-fold containing protein-5 [Coleophoma crateriformis]
MTRNVVISAVDGQTGFLIAELILTNNDFSSKIDSVFGLAMDINHSKCKLLKELGAEILHHVPGIEKDIVKILKHANADTICIIPPAHEEKFDITMELINATKKANMQNVCLLSAAGADMAERDKQPRLREFIDIEQAVLITKGDTSTETGHSPVIIRAGFYLENLLAYSPQAKNDRVIPLPIGDSHKFAPMALGDVALVTAHVLSGKGEHGFDDKHRGQLIVVTGPLLTAGNELAEAAKQALDEDMEFEDISPREAERVLKKQAETNISEIQYLLEYYSLVREGKLNYISTNAFHDITGQHVQEPVEWFKIYKSEFVKGEEKHQNKKRKMNGK